MQKNKQKYYITTAIAYASQRPHIGNMYDIVVTDLIARWKRMQGFDVRFLTGTDEHGQKIENAAAQAGVSPQAYVDGIVDGIRDAHRRLNISSDDFIRTTDPAHKRVIQKLFQKLLEQGDIYKGSYEGMYCVPCESFWTPSQLDENGMCPDCGREAAPAREEAYFLRLSKYQGWLEEHYEAHPEFIVPESRRKEMLNNFIKPGLQDLCVSRSSFRWGIPVESDPGHVIYVWIDALSNYITALGYDPDGSGELFHKFWPADMHVIGKDIVRFHTIYWPILLKALGLEQPKRVFGHQWLLFGSDKMSKSRGNVIYAEELAGRIGTDAVRYCMLADMPYGVDGSITETTVLERYNTDLANILGNLVNRTLAMTNKYFDGRVPVPGGAEGLDRELSSCAEQTVARAASLLEDCRVADAMEAILALAKRSNKYIDETAPWALAKEESQKERLGTVLYHLLECIRYLAILFAPAMPETAEKIKAQLCPEGGEECFGCESLSAFGGLPSGGRVTEKPVPLFARLDAKEFLASVLANE
ncbi:MAG: methionine--tRNA ligase [Oscillospiraceae bacterium]|nr:methionine--tRNA ligase [Oscillospiraceae bacterium]